MRFLCLHGLGSNSRILQQQTAAIRYELGNRHAYDFVEGTLPFEADPTLKDSMLGEEQTFTYCDPTSPESCLQVLKLLEDYVAAEGPFDGVLGFSLGANIATSWMMQRQRDGAPLPFKVGIFFSNTRAFHDLEALEQGRLENLVHIPEGSLDLPTAHIWGAEDVDFDGQNNAQTASRACQATKRSVHIHGKGHEISTAPEDLISMVKVINRALGQVGGLN